MIALILSMPFLDSCVCSSLIGAKGAAMLAELLTARCRGRATGGSLGTSANALRPKPLVDDKCCAANILTVFAVTQFG